MDTKDIIFDQEDVQQGLITMFFNKRLEGSATLPCGEEEVMHFFILRFNTF